MTYYDLGAYTRTITTKSAGGPGLVRPGPELGLRLQPRRGDRLLRQGAGARSRLRHGLLGHLLRGRAELQPALASLRSGRQGRRARRRLRRDAGGAGLRSGGASPVEQALIRALPARYPQREPIEDQSAWDAAPTPTPCAGVPREPRRPRGPQRLRRSDHEPDAVADVGPRDRRRRRRRRHGRGGRGAGGGFPQTSPPRGTIPACCISTST